jgi:hypothetical protein
MRRMETSVTDMSVETGHWPDERREFWWIYSDSKEEWGGLRIAAFSKVRGMGGPTDIFVIFGEVHGRFGIRIWDDASKREGWRKVEQIKVPMV